MSEPWGRSRGFRALALASALCVARPSHAEQDAVYPSANGAVEATPSRSVEASGAQANDEREVSSGRQALALGAAVVPGILLHGSGSYVLGRTQTAKRLLLLQGVGLGLLAFGGGILVTTGAARDFVGPAAAMSAAGVGLFSVSWLGDLYSVTAPVDGWGRDPGWTPNLETELGYRYVYDPSFPYRNFVVNAITARTGALRLTPSLWASPENANERFRTELAYRLRGPEPDQRSASGTFFDLEVAFTNHRYGQEGFALTTYEASLEGRWDLSDYDEHLRGAFVDFSLGAASQIYSWEVVPDDSISSTLLLAGFGFGVYLGDRSPEGGFVRAYYDHRHDDYAAGTLATGLGSGVIGHFGLEGLYYLSEHWGVRAEAQLGSALVVGASGLFRFGGDP